MFLFSTYARKSFSFDFLFFYFDISQPNCEFRQENRPQNSTPVVRFISYFFHLQFQLYHFCSLLIYWKQTLLIKAGCDRGERDFIRITTNSQFWRRRSLLRNSKCGLIHINFHYNFSIHVSSDLSLASSRRPSITFNSNFYLFLMQWQCIHQHTVPLLFFCCRLSKGLFLFRSFSTRNFTVYLFCQTSARIGQHN